MELMPMPPTRMRRKRGIPPPTESSLFPNDSERKKERKVAFFVLWRGPWSFASACSPGGGWRRPRAPAATARWTSLKPSSRASLEKRRGRGYAITKVVGFSLSSQQNHSLYAPRNQHHRRTPPPILSRCRRFRPSSMPPPLPPLLPVPLRHTMLRLRHWMPLPRRAIAPPAAVASAQHEQKQPLQQQQHRQQQQSRNSLTGVANLNTRSRQRLLQLLSPQLPPALPFVNLRLHPPRFHRRRACLRARGWRSCCILSKRATCLRRS